MTSRVLQTIVTLADSDDYRFVHVESMGIVSSYSPRTTRGDHQVMIFVSHRARRWCYVRLNDAALTQFL